MPSVSLLDLADMFVKKYYPGKNIKVEMVGNRFGEKIHEELLDDSDLSKFILSNGKIIIIVPKVRMGMLDKKEIAEPKYKGFKLVEELETFSSKNANQKESIINLI